MSALHGAALNPLGYWHHNDHLGPLCALLGLPLLLTDKEWVQHCARYYPGLQVEWVPWEDFSLDYLVQRYRVFFRSDIWERDAFANRIRPLEEKYGTRIRTVHVPHGFSDKAFWLEKCADEDISLIYGAHMEDMLRQRGVWSRVHRVVVTGNYRLAYYLQHKEALEHCVQEEVLQRFDRQQTTVLYAPTWRDQENSSSFFAAINALAQGLPPEINLLVKLHPMLEEKDIAELFLVLSHYEEESNIVFLDRFPLVYPLLSQVDAYLGDASAIGYDCLAFDLPLFFLRQDNQEGAIHRCGRSFPVEQAASVFSSIQESVERADDAFAVAKQKLYHYTFGEPVSAEQLSCRLYEALDS